MDRPLPSASASAPDPLADPELYRFLQGFVRKRVRAADVDDLVQAVLCDALAAQGRPSGEAELRRYLLGIARHKIADLHRRAVRDPGGEVPEIPTRPAPIEEREMARWAEQQAPTSEARRTLSWMAREGEGEKLESIAADEKVPATRVRQRVSRMRRWMKERWLAELAAVAALGIVVVMAYKWLVRPDEPIEAIVPDVPPTAPSAVQPPSDLERARTLRADALKQCESENYRACLDGLDEAARLDPAGDQPEEIQRARAAATDALRQEELPKAPEDKSEPKNVAPPKPVPPKPVPPKPVPQKSDPISPKDSLDPGPFIPKQQPKPTSKPKAPPPKTDIERQSEFFEKMK